MLAPVLTVDSGSQAVRIDSADSNETAQRLVWQGTLKLTAPFFAVDWQHMSMSPMWSCLLPAMSADARAYLARHQDLRQVIADGTGRISEVFGGATIDVLLARSEEYVDGENLVIRVHTTLAPEEAVKAIRNFYRTWLVPRAAAVGDRITVDISYDEL